MKKVIAFALLGFSLFGFSQVKISAKANVLVRANSAKWTHLKDAVVHSGKNMAGGNVGLSAKIDLPITAFFLMPEAYYTIYKDTYTDATILGTKLSATTHRLDIPVLLGRNLITDDFSLFVGPIFSYNFAQGKTYNLFQESVGNKFGVGFQFGGQLAISKLILTARYEGGFTKDQREFIHRITNQQINYDNRPSFVLLGLGYQF